MQLVRAARRLSRQLQHDVSFQHASFLGRAAGFDGLYADAGGLIQLIATGDAPLDRYAVTVQAEIATLTARFAIVKEMLPELRHE